LDDAIAYAAQKANLKNYRLKEYPESKSIEEKIEESFGEMKANAIKEELGDQYTFYKTVQWMKTTSGIQARMIYDLGL
jgi:protease-4